MENCTSDKNDGKIPAINDVEKVLNNELMNYFKGEKDGYIQVGTKKWFYPKKYEKLQEDYMNFEVRSDDVWITGLPRSGTTATQELAWLLTHNLDFEGAKESILIRVPFFENDMVLNDKTVEEKLKMNPTQETIAIIQRKDSMKLLNEKKERRVIKTHLPFELLPPDVLNKGCKVIYVCRFPKDVAVSYFFLQSKAWHINYVGDFQKYWTFFQNGNCMFGPYFEHVKQGYEKRNLKNFHFVFYEDLRKDLGKYIENLSEFLERPITKEEQDKLEEYLNFDNYQKNSTISTFEGKDKITVKFVRKGTVGGWTKHFTDDMNNKADQWIEENIKKIGLKYPN